MSECSGPVRPYVARISWHSDEGILDGAHSLVYLCTNHAKARRAKHAAEAKQGRITTMRLAFPKRRSREPCADADDQEEGASLVGRECLVQIVEPYEIATNTGEPLLEGRIVRFEQTEQGGVMWIEMNRPIETQGKRGDVMIVSSRHRGVRLQDLLHQEWIAAHADLASKDLLQARLEDILTRAGSYFAIVTVRLAR